MENLNELGLTELNHNKAEKINGGGIIARTAWWLAYSAVAGVIEGFQDDWKEVKESFQAGVEAGKS